MFAVSVIAGHPTFCLVDLGRLLVLLARSSSTWTVFDGDSCRKPRNIRVNNLVESCGLGFRAWGGGPRSCLGFHCEDTSNQLKIFITTYHLLPPNKRSPARTIPNQKSGTTFPNPSVPQNLLQSFKRDYLYTLQCANTLSGPGHKKQLESSVYVAMPSVEAEFTVSP